MDTDYVFLDEIETKVETRSSEILSEAETRSEKKEIEIEIIGMTKDTIIISESYVFSYFELIRWYFWQDDGFILIFDKSWTFVIFKIVECFKHRTN